MNVFELFAKLNIDTSGFESGLTNAGKKAQGFGGKVGTAMKAGAVAVATIGTAVAGATTAFAKQASQVAEYGDHIDKMSQKIGISAESYQEWDAIMQHTGASIDSLAPSMKTLSVQAQKGNEAFEKLGISESEVANLSKEDLFAKVVSGLQGMESGTERTYLASQLLGRGATELGALLNTSAEETEAMRQRVHELGGVMSDEAVKASAKFQDSLQDLKTGFQGLKRNLMSNFLPAISTVMDGLSEILIGNTDKGLEVISGGIDEAIAQFSDKLPKVLEIVSGIIQSLLMAIVKNLPKIFKAGTSLVMNLFDGFIQNLDKIVDAGLQAVLALAEGIGDALPKLIPSAVSAVMKIVETIIQNLNKISEVALEIIKGLAQGLLDALPVLIRSLPSIITGIVDFLLDSIPQLIDAGIELLTSLVDEIPTIISEICLQLPKIITGIISGVLSHIDDFINAGIELFVSLVSNTAQIVLGIVSKIPEIVEGIINGFVDAFRNGDFARAGKALVDGLIKGILENKDSFMNKLMQFFGVPIGVLQKTYEIKSPSRVMKRFGNMISEGLAIGIDESGADVIKNAENVSNGIYDALNGDYEIGASVKMNDITTSRNAFVGSQDAYTDGSEAYTEEIIIPQNQMDSGRDLTVILELDRMQLGRAVYRLNQEETQRVGVQLAGGLS